MSTLDPWEEFPVTYTARIPRWILDNARIDYDDPTMTADELVALWIENMEANAYDIARDEGRLPAPPLG